MFFSRFNPTPSKESLLIASGTVPKTKLRKKLRRAALASGNNKTSQITPSPNTQKQKCAWNCVSSPVRLWKSIPMKRIICVCCLSHWSHKRSKRERSLPRQLWFIESSRKYSLHGHRGFGRWLPGGWVKLEYLKVKFQNMWFFGGATAIFWRLWFRPLF